MISSFVKYVFIFTWTALVIESTALPQSDTLMRYKRPFREPFVLFRSYNTTKNELVFDAENRRNELLKLKVGHDSTEPAVMFKPAHKIDRYPSKKAYSIKNHQVDKKQNSLYSQRKRHGINQIKSIYKTLANGETILNDKNINTVRYIPSTKIDSNNKLYFLFNLSQLTSTERVLKSDLFLNRKYIRQMLTFDMHYFYYSTFKSTAELKRGRDKDQKTGASMTIDLSNFQVNRFNRHYHWNSFNILESINSYLSIRGREEMVANKTSQSNVYYTYDKNANQIKQPREGDELVLIMEATSNNRNRRRRNKIFPENFNPYLMVYSSEDEEQMQQFFESRITDKLESSITSSNSNQKQPAEKLLQHVSEEEIAELAKFEKQVDTYNQIDEEQNIDSVGDSIDTTDNKQRDTNFLADYLIKKSPSHQSSLGSYDDYLAKTDKIIYGDYRNRLQKREANDLNLVVFDESKFDLKETKVKDELNMDKCDKKSLLVDFMDISFSDWILEPKRFQSNYCSGGCQFPTNKKVTYSNYATLQSILSSLNFLNTKNSPPELCCTPSSTTPLPILYIDQNSRDYIVKLLPDMIVNECSCR